ncbi:MAG: [acyl-carrier-protein] S-malonyltransferase, partial [Lentisphaeraceae bacterium]|nr:[acyl-carrier-protein] S-malonyltransferase [Lentisphaeraceae bacterium]
NTPNIPVISNLEARPYSDDNILKTLVGQISNSVRWVESIRYIKAQEENAEFTELGPGAVLTSLIKQIG